MNQEEYIKERLDDQIIWYSTKSVSNQKKHKYWQVIKIIAALLVTTLSLLVKEYPIMVYVIGVLGAFIVFTKWRGANVLGQILMKVRERLRE